MASLLGSKYCIESLKSDVSDLQSAVADVLSRVGPSASFRSWKYPDKMSTEVNIAELLETHVYSEDEEERQIAHIVLMELVIDRLILLLQLMGTFVEMSCSKMGITSGLSTTSNSVGPIVKKYWNRTLQLCTSLSKTMSQSKTKSKKIAQLESSLAQLKSGSCGDVMKPSLSDTVTSVATGRVVPPGHDEYSKACQTVETAFVPCEGCYLVQQSLREAGRTLVTTCETLSLTSHLARYQTTVSGLDWLSANDVSRWTTNQSKDIASIGAHVNKFSSTIESLNCELNAERKKSKETSSRIAATKKEAAVERETSASMRRQFEAKLKESEKATMTAMEETEQQKTTFAACKTELEQKVNELQSELTEQKTRLRKLEQSKLDLMHEMEKRAANSDQVKALQSNIDGMAAELAHVSTKLQEAAVQLSKEKARNKAVSEHTSSVQSKQESLLQRLDELDRDNDSLRSQVAELEESRDQLLQQITLLTHDKDQLIQQINDKETLHSSLSKQADDVKQLQVEIRGLEDQLKAAKENERLLVEYPDLHFVNNSTVSMAGTGDLAQDMENQMKANGLRIEVLERENAKLKKSLCKLLGVNDSSTVPGRHGSAPVQLWNYNANSSEERTTLTGSGRTVLAWAAASDSNTTSVNPVTRNSGVAGKKARAVHQSVLSVGGRETRQPGKQERLTANTSNSGSGSGAKLSSQLNVDVFTCAKCDKMYSSSRELTIHQSYCCARL